MKKIYIWRSSGSLVVVAHSVEEARRIVVGEMRLEKEWLGKYRIAYDDFRQKFIATNPGQCFSETDWANTEECKNLMVARPQWMISPDWDISSDPEVRESDNSGIALFDDSGE